MKRIHIHVSVDDIDQSVAYYTALFGAAPTRREADYAKWLLDDPAANIAISSHGATRGVDHLGLSLDSREALDAIAARLDAIDTPALAQEDATCCYAKSDKYWSRDPQGAVWELFHTFGDSEVYGDTGRNPTTSPTKQTNACC